jgi:hypothetical protein
MAERVETDGKKFWRFPELPYDVGQQVRALYNFYMRTNPQTGLVELDKWAVYPNNSTPKTLGPLLDMLALITAQNAVALAGIAVAGLPPAAAQRMGDDHSRWVERLQLYQAKVAELVQVEPDSPVGGGSAVSKELARYVVEPLFLGWYPHDVAPFSSQPPPYSSQIGQSVMDIYSPYTMANQLAITEAALADAYAQFKRDLAENAEVVFTEIIPVIPALKAVPFLVAGAVGLALFTWLRK